MPPYRDVVSLDYRPDTDSQWILTEVWADVVHVGTTDLFSSNVATRQTSYRVTVKYDSVPEALWPILLNERTDAASPSAVDVQRVLVTGRDGGQRDLVIVNTALADDRRSVTFSCQFRLVQL